MIFQQAERLANFAQAMTLDERPSRTLGREVNAMDSPTAASVDITCNYCKKKGHLTEECRKTNRDGETKKKIGFKGRKRDEVEKKKKNWTLIVYDQVNELADTTTATSGSDDEEDETMTSITE
jgi:hypothetical protein